MSGFITAVSLNPAIDRTITIPSFTLGATNRVAGGRTDPGGKGINVAWVEAIKNGGGLIERALAAAPAAAAPPADAPVKEAKKAWGAPGWYKHLMTGVSYMIPFTVAGGIIIALSFIWGIEAVPGTLPAHLATIGGQGAFGFMVLVLAGYLTAFLARAIKLPKSMEGLKPVFILPLLATLITGLLMIYVVGLPMAWIMAGLTNWLTGLGQGSALVLGLVLGAMMAADMGGPINKAAYAFAVGLLGQGVFGPQAAVMAAGMTPPLGLALATVLAPRKFTSEERQAGKAAWVLGLSFISEGAIPFAAADPLRVIPAAVAGSAVAGGLSMLFGVTLRAPHGGIFVLPIPHVVENVGLYALAIIVGTVVTALVASAIKPVRDERGTA